MRQNLRLVAWAAAFLAAGAQAQGYLEGHLVPTRITGSHGLNSNPTPTVFLGVLGYDLHPNLAVEGAVGFNLNKDTSTASAGGSTFNVETQIKSLYGLYLKPHYHFSDSLEGFVRLGHLRTKLDMSAPAGAPFASGDHASGATAWALGVNYAFDKNSYFSLGYNRFGHNSGMTIKGVNLGLGYRF